MGDEKGQEKHLFVKNSRDRKLAAVLALPGEGRNPPLVVICHGFTSSKDSGYFKTLSDFLVQNGFACLRFDFGGHGESEEKFEDMTVSKEVDDLKSVFRDIKRLRGFDRSRIGVFGSSLGGMVAVLAAPDLPVKALVLGSPLSDFRELWDARVDKAAKAVWKRRGRMSFNLNGKRITLKYDCLADGTRHDVYAAAGKITAPTAIIHGTADRIVPVSQSERLFSSMGGIKNLHKLQNCDHDYTNPMHLKIMLGITIGWFKRFLMPESIRAIKGVENKGPTTSSASS